VCDAAEKYDEVMPFKVSVGQGIRVADLASRIADVVGYIGRIIYDHDKPDGAPMKSSSAALAMEKVEWRPRSSLGEGIQETLRWLDANYAYAVRERESEAAH
jgi:GDP-L-fucose synthase